MSYTERVKLEINTLCNSVSLYLCVENTFETASEPFLLFFITLQKHNRILFPVPCPMPIHRKVQAEHREEFHLQNLF